ncbi:hypothetical protein [Promicromonospora sp. NPDC059942]|uniref:hypothetical protein n=1 Tax=Promicromonospora sp. NPDC059942 TaxID=3347009 RepID=UPI003650315F
MSTTGDPRSNEILLDLLRQAATAHGVHEQEELGGVYDEGWPEWYTEHMTRTLAEQGYRIVPADGPVDGPADAPAATPEGADDEQV